MTSLTIASISALLASESASSFSEKETTELTKFKNGSIKKLSAKLVKKIASFSADASAEISNVPPAKSFSDDEKISEEYQKKLTELNLEKEKLKKSKFQLPDGDYDSDEEFDLQADFNFQISQKRKILTKKIESLKSSPPVVSLKSQLFNFVKKSVEEGSSFDEMEDELFELINSMSSEKVKICGVAVDSERNLEDRLRLRHLDFNCPFCNTKYQKEETFIKHTESESCLKKQNSAETKDRQKKSAILKEVLRGDYKNFKCKTFADSILRLENGKDKVEFFKHREENPDKYVEK